MNEKPYQRYFESIPGYLTVQDHDFRIVDANQRFLDDFGDHEGRYCYQVYKHRSEKCLVCPVEKTFQDGLSHSSEEQVQCLSGKMVSVVTYTTPLRDEKGQIAAVMEMSTDITDIKQLLWQLRRSQERYQLLFDQAPCYITIQDRSLKIIEANQNFRSDFGRFLGCSCWKIYKHRGEECLICPVMQTFEDGQSHTSEEVVTSLSGEQKNVMVYTAPIMDSRGNIQFVMEMSSDITPIRKLQTQLESMGILISSISHGIKGMLNGLDGGIYLVNSGMKKGDDKRLEQGWEIVQRNVDRIRGMVLNILYYAKEREPNYEPIDAPAFADEICGLLEPKAAEHNTRVQRQIDADTGSFDGDPMSIRALLINLLENSLDACKSDKKKNEHQITFALKGEPDLVEFNVTDNGIGMDREVREKALTIFFSSKGAEGTGLGLFISNNIAQAHGGVIELESEKDRGTTFRVKIPRKRIVPEK